MFNNQCHMAKTIRHQKNIWLILDHNFYVQGFFFKIIQLFLHQQTTFAKNSGKICIQAPAGYSTYIQYFFSNVTLLYFLSHMQLENSKFQDNFNDGKRPRLHLVDLEEPSPLSRKRHVKNHPQEENPYEAIPQVPNVKLTQQEMNSDPIQVFMKLEQLYSSYGAVKVTVNQKWKCPYQQRFVDKGITTRIQHLSKLKHGKAFEQNVETYSFHSYEAYALNFEKTYKYKTHPKGKTVESKKQYQYWSLVTKPQYEKSNVKVQYAADLASTKYGSLFPVYYNPRCKDENFNYQSNLFNLNNIANSPCSILSMAAERKEKVSGITHPWVYMGSMFSTFCWHVQDLNVNSLNYNHKGSIKTWYVVPGAYKQNFDDYIKGRYCLNNHKETLLDRITFMVDPLQLIKVGIPVYKAYQRPRDYICTFFSAYHCGFSQGYNVGEAVNFLSPLSIKVMKQAIVVKKNNPKSPPCVIPIQWIIYENYGKIGSIKVHGQKIRQAYKQMINEQRKRLEQINGTYNIGKIIVYPEQKKYDKIYCNKCKQYLYLHAFQTREKKIYCDEHFKSEQNSNDEAALLVRKPNNDRKYILQMFAKSQVQETDSIQINNKEKPKSAPKMRMTTQP